MKRKYSKKHTQRIESECKNDLVIARYVHVHFRARERKWF